MSDRATGMSEERLAELRARATKPCNCGNSDCEEGTAFGLTPREAEEVLAEVERLRGEVARGNQEIETLNRELEVEREQLADSQARVEELDGPVDELEPELTKARARLAEIGETRKEWGVRTYDNDDDTEVMSSLEQARDLADAWRREIPGSNPTVMTRTVCDDGPWRVADKSD